MINTPIKITFSLLVVVFVLISIGMFIPPVAAIMYKIGGPIIVFSEWGLFFILGTILIVLTIKNRVEGSIKKFFLITGISAVGFIAFVLLHNLVSGLLSQVFKKEIEEPVFFILATLVSPIGFIIGAIGSINQLVKKKQL